MLGARDPDLLAADHVAVAATDGGGLELRGVGPRGRLADAEGLEPQLSGRDPGQQRGLLFVGSVPQQRAHRVHLRVAGAGIGATPVDFLEDDRRFVDAQAGAAVRLRDQGRQITGVGERFHERVGIGAGRIQFAPVAVGKVLAQIADPGAQILMRCVMTAAVIILGPDPAKRLRSLATRCSTAAWVAGPLHPAKRLRYARTPVARSTPPRLCGPDRPCSRLGVR